MITWLNQVMLPTHPKWRAQVRARSLAYSGEWVGHPYHAPICMLPCKRREQRCPCCAMCDQKRLVRTRSAARLMEKSKLPQPQSTARTGDKYNPKAPKGLYVDSHRTDARLDLGNQRLGGESCSCSPFDGWPRKEVLDCNNA